MSLEVNVDMANFRRAVDLALANSSRELSVATNARMYFLLRRALDLTKRASRQAIEKLGVYRFDVYTKKGTVRKRAQLVQAVNPNTLAFIRINQAKNPNFARKFGSRGELQEAAKKWTTRKFSAVGFLASLWIKAIRRFDRNAGSGRRGLPPDASGAARLHENVGGLAVIARPGFSPVAQGGFRVGDDAGGVALRGYAQKLALDALRQAMAAETAEIMRHMEEKAKKACRDAGMVVR